MRCTGNYSPVLVTQLAAKKEGYADVVYLDAKTDTYLEEVSSCNVFAVFGRTIRTPPLQASAWGCSALGAACWARAHWGESTIVYIGVHPKPRRLRW